MMRCQFYRASDTSSSNQLKDHFESNSSEKVKPRCRHQCANRDMRDNVSCKGDFTRCCIHLGVQQLSDFIQSEMPRGRVELIYNNNDDGGVLKIENGTWTAMELTRRFGRRQSREEETIMEIKDHGFTFSQDSLPASFGNSVVFPLAAI